MEDVWRVNNIVEPKKEAMVTFYRQHTYTVSKNKSQPSRSWYGVTAKRWEPSPLQSHVAFSSRVLGQRAVGMKFPDGLSEDEGFSLRSFIPFRTEGCL
ncbi:hypothetical protein TNIN_352641 [Trichonephila inaurata madagascariensis]|uniref:Uncharacterized protein n=1 Tax=Trichonephila inaurata madagascariensis TaxID=2747483 RepID=A0A8X6MDI3_9ARAC|nr:hypothetical protein TNIN_352641 [Trichonephila inaurata madagascariensis]